jgi:hypothetical protein
MRTFAAIRDGHRLFHSVDRQRCGRAARVLAKVVTTIRLSSRGSVTRFASALALVLACGSSRPRAADGKPDGGRAPQSSSGASTPSTAKAPARKGCDRAAPALPAAPLTVEWQREEAVHRVSLARDGTVRLHGAVVARLSGACVLDGRGEVLRSVDARNMVSDARQRPVGVFQRKDDLHEASGQTVPVGEVLASPDGTMTAVTDDGTVYLARPGQDAFSLPASVEGEVSRARRTALLLLDLGPELDGAAR